MPLPALEGFIMVTEPRRTMFRFRMVSEHIEITPGDGVIFEPQFLAHLKTACGASPRLAPEPCPRLAPRQSQYPADEAEA